MQYFPSNCCSADYGYSRTQPVARSPSWPVEGCSVTKSHEDLWSGTRHQFLIICNTNMANFITAVVKILRTILDGNSRCETACHFLTRHQSSHLRRDLFQYLGERTTFKSLYYSTQTCWIIQMTFRSIERVWRKNIEIMADVISQCTWNKKIHYINFICTEW